MQAPETTAQAGVGVPWWRGALLGGVVGAALAALVGALETEAAQAVVIASGAIAGAFWLQGIAQRRRIRRLQSERQALEPLVLAGISTSGLAHEIKNGLMVTRGFAGLARRRADRTGDERLVQQVDAIERESERLIRELRSFIRTAVEEHRFWPAASARPITLENARSVVESVASLVRPLAREQEMALELDATLSSEWAVDEPALRSALTNLLLNAMAHARSRIRLTARETFDGGSQGGGAARLEVAVEDDGPGVPEEIGELVFQRGFTRGVRDGTGVGLAFARERATRAGGTLALAPSDAAGARFVLSLPLHPPLPPEP